MSASAAPITVLVVEDEFFVRMAAIDVIMDAGYAVETANNADEAIAVLEANRLIRIVFTDINMPGSMDGLKLAHYIRGRWPPIELIVTSAFFASTSDLPERALFLPKPYIAADLATNLQQLAKRLSRGAGHGEGAGQAG